MLFVSLFADNASVNMEQLDERVVSMYKSIKQILQKYRSGKLPKAFKVIPNLQNWEQVQYIIHHFHPGDNLLLDTVRSETYRDKSL